jgi:hypothetical protein
MAVGGGTGLIAYATGPFGGISVLMMLDVGIGCYGWFVWRGPNFQAQHESHLHGAYEIGVIARSLASYNATAYAKYRLNAAWLKGIKPPLQRMAADNDIDYALRFIWRLVAERYAAANWAVDRTRLRDRQQLLDKAVVAGMEADLAVERILAIGRQYPGFGIKPGLLEWDIPGLKPPTPTT